MTEKPHDIRCGKCNRKLGEGQYIRLAIKCPRCGVLNHYRASTPMQHAHERPTLKKDNHGFFKNSNAL